MDVENTQQQDSPDITSSGAEATREELIAAAREAIGSSAEPEAVQAPPEQPAQPATPDPEERLNSVLRAREEAHKKRLEADTYADQRRHEAEAERKRIIDEARAEAKRIADQELADLRAKYRSSPTATIRALAEDGNVQSVVDDVIREGTPEARALAQAREEARLAREDAKAGKGAAEELAKFKADLQREKQEQAVSQIRSEFISTVATPEKAPYLNARFEPEEVFDRCDRLCRDWQADGLKLGIDFDRDTLVAYLEKQSRERFTKLPGLTPAQQSGAGAPAREPGIAPKSAANGTRTITAASSSERRASPKPFNELSPAEQREDLIRVAQEAFRQHGQT